jgi:hypothetical protein
VGEVLLGKVGEMLLGLGEREGCSAGDDAGLLQAHAGGK